MMLPPSAFMTSMAALFFGLAVVLIRANAIFLPLGDHSGPWSSELVGVLFCVSCVRLLPSAFIVKIAATAASSWTIGPNARSKAIFLPSGE